MIEGDALIGMIITLLLLLAVWYVLSKGDKKK